MLFSTSSRIELLKYRLLTPRESQTSEAYHNQDEAKLIVVVRPPAFRGCKPDSGCGKLSSFTRSTGLWQPST
jgi:hypothetical protein